MVKLTQTEKQYVDSIDIALSESDSLLDKQSIKDYLVKQCGNKNYEIHSGTFVLCDLQTRQIANKLIKIIRKLK